MVTDKEGLAEMPIPDRYKKYVSVTKITREKVANVKMLGGRLLK